MGDFEHVRAGDAVTPPTAAAWNAMLDAGQNFQSSRSGTSRRVSPLAAGGCDVLVKNTTGSAVGRFAVLGISGIVIAPADNLPLFQTSPILAGRTPTADDADAFAVLLEPIAAGAIGAGRLAGVVPVQVNVTDTDHGYAVAAAGDSAKLASAAAGIAHLLYPAAETGSQWCLVRLSNPWQPGVATLSWAAASNNWHNVAANGSYVDAYPCDNRDGDNPGESTIRIYLPRSPGRDPNVVLDQIVGYTMDVAGDYIAQEAYADDAIGAVKIWSKTGTLPAGWVECAPGTGASATMQALSGSFPVGVKSTDGDWNAIGNYGNQDRKEHAHTMERDIPNPPMLPVWLDEGTWQTTHLSTALTNHIPPWCAVRFIERIDNSAT